MKVTKEHKKAWKHFQKALKSQKNQVTESNPNYINLQNAYINAQSKIRKEWFFGSMKNQYALYEIYQEFRRKNHIKIFFDCNTNPLAQDYFSFIYIKEADYLLTIDIEKTLRRHRSIPSL